MIVPIRVLIVDDDALVRSGLTMMLSGAPQIEVIGEADDGRGVLAAVDLHRPDVVLMDIRMPRLDGIAATRLLSAQPHPPAVLVLTTFDADELVLRALQAGAAGFLLKDSPPADIVRAIDSVYAGDGMLSPRITRRLINLVGGDPDDAARREQARQRLAALTPREREVAAAVADGSSNAEIATRLHMSLATVKAHVSRLLVKLDAANRVQIALLVQDAAAGRPRLSMTPDQLRRNDRSARLLANRQSRPRPSVDDAWLMSALARSALAEQSEGAGCAVLDVQYQPAAGQPDDGDAGGLELGLLVPHETGQRGHRLGPVPDPRPGRGDVHGSQRHARARSAGGPGKIDHIHLVDVDQLGERGEQAGIDLAGGQRAAGRAGSMEPGVLQQLAAEEGPLRHVGPQVAHVGGGPFGRHHPDCGLYAARPEAGQHHRRVHVLQPGTELAAHGLGRHDQIAAQRGRVAPTQR
jgi:DNA-binding NarL/FixJ family response regulator